MEKQVSTMRVLIGLWLAFLYAVCISGVVVSLTLFQLQHKILATPERPPQPEGTMAFHECSLDRLDESDIGKGGTHNIACIPIKTSINQGFQSPAKILELLEAQDRYVRHKIQESEERQKLLDSLRLEELNNSAYVHFRQGFLSIQAKEKERRGLESEVAKLTSELKGLINENATVEEQESSYRNSVSLRLQETESRVAYLEQEIKNETVFVNEHIERLSGQPEVVATLNLAATPEADLQDALQAKFEKYFKDETELNREIENINAQIDSFKAQSVHLVDIKTDIAFYRKFFPDAEKPGENAVADDKSIPFWAAPFHLLTLVLILSMGALGSLIFLTNDFLERDNAEDKFSMYIFRPLLGMSLALSIFVMFKSGQAVLGVDTGQRQSPFLIAFIGLISGLLAEKAYRRITTEGEKLFAVEKLAPDEAGLGSSQTVKRSAE